MKNDNGSILITTLWIMAILTVFAMGIGFRALLELRLSKYNMERLKARYLARAGIVKATQRLLTDKRLYDTSYECGIFLKEEEVPADIFSAQANTLGKGSFSVYYKRKGDLEGIERIYYGMLDEEKKVNINFDKIPSSDKIGEYKRILKGLSPNMTEEIINAMIDWQDGGDFDAATLPGGAEDSYYEEQFGYDCKDGNFESIEELLLVKGMTREIFNEIKDYITVYTDGRININTAPREVMNAFIDDGKGTYGPLLDNIESFREGEDGVEGTMDDGVFTAIGEINLIPEEDDIQGKNRLSQLQSYFTVKSDNFRIISHGSTGNRDAVITCIVTEAREGEEEESSLGIKIKYYNEE